VFSVTLRRSGDAQSWRKDRVGFASQTVGVGYICCHMKKDLQAWRGWVWPLGFAIAIVIESSQSHVPLPAGIWQMDKIVHFLAFGLLATVTVRALRIESPRWRAIVAVLLVSLFGASDEIHQYFTPGRSCDIFDWLADTLGAGLAVSLYLFWPAWRRLLEIRPRAHKASASSASTPSPTA